jgi:hypoxia up-regulated 1
MPKYNETRSGVTLKIDGIDFTPEELVAMVLVHAVDISVAHAASQGNDKISPPKDVVLTTPSFATQHERRALLDAASLADLNVLELIDENTAAAVQYAMDKKFEQDQLLLFYNMGASALQVSVIRFFSYDKPERYGKPKSVPAVEVLAKAWDATLGGDAFDHLLVEYLADQFNHAWYKTGRAQKGKDDVRQHLRAMTKLRIQANKVKHVLSANTEIPVYMDAVHDDVALSAHISRDLLEELSTPLLQRAVEPIHHALRLANKTMDDLTGIELLGGGMRIPRVQNELKATFGDKLELGLHMNADESMALGAAFVGANVSTAFRVRHVGLTDLNPFGLQVTLSNLPDQTASSKDDEEWSKSAVVFKSFGKTGVKRTITFTHDKNVHCALDYVDEEPLPKGTTLSLDRYNVTGVAEFAKEMEEKNLTKPKVSLQFELGTSGITTLVRAEASVEETYTIEEEIEVEDDEAVVNASDVSGASNSTSGSTAPEGENVTADESNATASVDANSTNATKVKKPKKTILVPKVRILLFTCVRFLFLPFVDLLTLTALWCCEGEETSSPASVAAFCLP